MIIQIKCTAKRVWSDRCYCPTKAEAEKEVKALKKIYRFNEFQIIPGKNLKIPKAKYHGKTDADIDTIVRGVDGLIEFKGQKDAAYMTRMAKVLNGPVRKKKK